MEIKYLLPSPLGEGLGVRLVRPVFLATVGYYVKELSAHKKKHTQNRIILPSETLLQGSAYGLVCA